MRTLSGHHGDIVRPSWGHCQVDTGSRSALAPKSASAAAISPQPDSIIENPVSELVWTMEAYDRILWIRSSPLPAARGPLCAGPHATGPLCFARHVCTKNMAAGRLDARVMWVRRVVPRLWTAFPGVQDRSRSTSLHPCCSTICLSLVGHLDLRPGRFFFHRNTVFPLSGNPLKMCLYGYLVACAA